MKYFTKKHFNSRCARAGFTMVEMIMVVTIFSIIGAGIAASFIAGMKIWGRARNIDFAQNNAFLSLEIVARELRQSVNISSVSFAGESNKFSFPTLVNKSIAKVTYVFDSQAKTLRRKLVKLEDVIAENSDNNYEEKEVLSADAISFSFFCYDTEQEQYFWRETCQEEKQKCIAVKIEVTIKDYEFTKTVFIPTA